MNAHERDAKLRSKLPSVGTTIFTVMSRLAADLGAINLSQGFPDFDCDPALVEAVARHMRAGRNQYAPMQGVPALREAIAAKYETFYGRRYDPETEVTVTSGGTEAIFDAVAAVVHPGDEVIVLEPCYDSYVPAIELAGGVPVVVPLRFRTTRSTGRGARGRHAANAAADASTRRTTRPARCSRPPTFRSCIALVNGTDIVIVSDEVYEHIIFDGMRHESMARHRRTRRAQLRRRLIRQDLSHDRMEDRIRGRAGGVDRRVPQGASVRHVFDHHAGAVRARRVLSPRRGLRELSPFFQAKRDLFLRTDGGIAVPSVDVAAAAISS